MHEEISLHLQKINMQHTMIHRGINDTNTQGGYSYLHCWLETCVISQHKTLAKETPHPLRHMHSLPYF